MISISVSREDRIEYLTRKGMSEDEAITIINRDAGEENAYGQHTRDAFQLADVFIRQDSRHQKTLYQLRRFLDLVFGNPFVGIGPRRFFDLFSMKLSNGYQMKRKAKGGAKLTWSRSGATARVPMLPTSYIEREALLSSIISTIIEESDGQDQNQA